MPAARKTFVSDPDVQLGQVIVIVAVKRHLLTRPVR